MSEQTEVSWPDAATKGQPPDWGSPHTLRHMTAAELTDINGLDPTTGILTPDSPHASMWFQLMFPSKIDITGLYMLVNNPANNAWLSFAKNSSAPGWGRERSSFDSYSSTEALPSADIDILVSPLDRYRTEINIVDLPSTISLYGNIGESVTGSQLLLLHVYGIPVLRENKLVFLEDTPPGDMVEFTTLLDYEDSPPEEITTKRFKVHNSSLNEVLEEVQIYADAVDNWYTFSSDGWEFSATLDLGSFGPGVEKLVYMRRTIPSDATLGDHVARIVVTHNAVLVP